MKNIHVLPTDKPSSLFEIDGHLIINKEQLIQPKYYRNIYITSDEGIKEGDWHFNLALNLVEKTTSFHNGLLCEKIILTTDQDLIKFTAENDGVQAIDDEFLEWFVRNPSCEEVEVDKFISGRYFVTNPTIPKEEPKQTDEKGRTMTYWGGLEEPKQETLEEVDEIITTTKFSWQQERSYSEEEVIAFGEFIFKHSLLTHTRGVKNLFEQFKKEIR
jgi:hypothetical protein